MPEQSGDHQAGVHPVHLELLPCQVQQMAHAGARGDELNHDHGDQARRHTQSKSREQARHDPGEQHPEQEPVTVRAEVAPGFDQRHVQVSHASRHTEGDLEEGGGEGGRDERRLPQPDKNDQQW